MMRRPLKRTSWSTRPSWASSDVENSQSSQLMRLPSTVKDVPSGWVISIGLKPSRSGTEPSAYSPSASGIGLTSYSSIARTRCSSRSKMASMLSIGRA